MNKNFFIEEGLSDYVLMNVASWKERALEWALQNEEPLHKYIQLEMIPSKFCEISANDIISGNFKRISEMIAKNNYLRRKKERAKAMGLAYWPAYVYGPEIDIQGYLIAENILAEKNGYWGNTNNHFSHGGWDMNDHYGISPYTVANMWFASGCKDGQKFKMQVTSRILAKKGDSPNFFANYIRGFKWLCQNRLNPGSFARKAISTLGRLSAHCRWAAIYNLEYETIIRIRDLNWGAVKEVSAPQKFKKSKYCPLRLQWQIMEGIDDIPNGLRGISPVQPKFNKGLYSKLCDLLYIQPLKGDDSAEGHRLPCWKLASVFSSVQEIQRFCKCSELTSINIHDAGQFPMPTSTSKEWASLCLKFGAEVLKYASNWKVIQEKLGGFPKSLNELRLIGDQFKYDGIDLNLTDSCSLVKFTQKEAEEYASFWKKLQLKNFETIPAVTGSDSKYNIVSLNAHDSLAPLVGILTNCCQHPNGAAHSCAKASVESPNAAIWAIFNKSEMIAQTFVWRSKNTLVLDSVEAKDKDVAPRIASLLKTACLSTIGKLGIKHIHIGKTSYGISRELCDIWDVSKTAPVTGCPSKYSDAAKQRRLF